MPSPSSPSGRGAKGGALLPRAVGGGARSVLAVAATSLLFALAATNATRQIAAGVMDDGVLWADDFGRVVASRVEAGGAGDLAGIRPGDSLQAISHPAGGGVFEVNRADEVPEILRSVDAESHLRYVLVREGERRGLTLTVAPLPAGNVSLYLFLAAVGVFAAGVGTFVYAFRRGVSAAAHFYGLCVLWLLAFSFSFTGELDFFDHLFFWLDRVGVLFFPAVFLHFALTFPSRSRFLEREPRLLRWAYAAPFALLGLSLFARLLYFSALSPGPGVITVSETVLDRLEPVLWAVYSFAAFAAFVDAFRAARSVTVRKQLKWIVWGTGAGMLPFALVYAVPYFSGISPTPAMELSLAAMVLAPLSFAYAIVKYRLMDVEILFKRGLLFAGLMAGIAAVYLAAFLLGTSWLGGDEHSLIIAVLSAIVAALLVPAFRQRAERFLDRLFYRERYDFRRAFTDLAGEMNSQLDLVPLGNQIVERIASTFRMERVTLLTATGAPADPTLRAVASRGLDDDEVEAAEAFVASASVRKRLAVGSPASTADLPPRVSEGAWVRNALPCYARGEVVGVIALGATEDGDDLSSEDLDLLRTLAAQAATALVNARLYSSLQAKHEEVVALREQSEDTIESLAAGVVVLDLGGRVIRWNRSMERIYGRSRHEVSHSSYQAVFPPELIRALDAGLGAGWLTGGARGGVSRHNLKSADGIERVVNVKAAPFVSGGGEHHGALLIFEDITERVGMENEMQLREKMSSLGVLAAGVAHEVNTPLAGISSFTQMLQDQTEGEDPRRPLLNKIEQQTERASRIVNGLLNFARHRQTEFAPVDLNRVLGEVLSLLDHQLRASRIRIRRDLDARLPPIRGDGNRLQQVFVNLSVNAFDAMPAGGWLTLTTRADGDQVIAEVADTGEGIAPEDIRRIYDPFFSTRKKSGGNGLGLSISYGIVQEHGGVMEVESGLNSGTRFVIRFPAADASAVGAPEPAGRTASASVRAAAGNRARARKEAGA